MKKFVTVIGFFLQIVPALCFAQDWQQKKPTACDSCTVLTPTEVRQVNRIYDDRAECYAQYIAAVQLADKWRQNYDLKSKQADKLREQQLTMQQVQDMTDAEFEQLQQQVKKLHTQQKLLRTVVWVLSGYAVASTAVAAVFIAAK